MSSNRDTTQSKYLRYGQNIMLKSSNKDGEKEYFLAAKSVHIPTVYFLKEKKQLNDLEHFYPDIGEMAFQIMPRLYFESNQKYKELERGDPKKGLYMKRKSVEDQLNESIVESSLGKPVQLGDTIQLKHPATGLYIKISSSKGQSGHFNVLGLGSTISIACQFKVKSNLTFNKDGAKIRIVDDFYLISANKAIIYPANEDIEKQSILTIKDLTKKRSIFRKTKKINLRIPHCTEEQELMTPIQAGNININTMNKDFRMMLKAVKLGSLNYNNQEDTHIFRYGDTLRISVLHPTGHTNTIFSGCNLSSLLDTPCVRFDKNSTSSEYKGPEDVFQLLPGDKDEMNDLIEFDENNEAQVFLKHVLTGKMLYMDRTEGRMKLADSFDKYIAVLDRQAGQIQSKYNKDFTEYKQIMEDKTLKNKDKVINKKFTSGQIDLLKMMKKTNRRILDSKEEYIDQYERDMTITLVKMTQGDSELLQTSSFFRIRTFEGEYIKMNEDKEEYSKLISSQSGMTNEPYFQRKFDYTDYFECYFCNTVTGTERPDYFYFDKIEGVTYNTKRLDYCITDFVRYLHNDEYNSRNLTDLNMSLRFLKKEMTQPYLTQTEYQNYIRENCLVDLMMKILERLYMSEFMKVEAKLIKVCNNIVDILIEFLEKNEASSKYLFQWEAFFTKFLKKPRLLEGRTEMISLISAVYEKTGNYEQYLEHNLRPVCEEIEFHNFNVKKLKEFLAMVEMCLKLNSPQTEEYILKTAIFSERKDKIFHRFSIGADGTVQVPVSKARTIKVDPMFCISEEKERKYIIDLVKAAAVLVEMAPNRVSAELVSSFPKDACLKIITDESLMGELRGAFITIYKTLHIMSEIPKYDLVKIDSNIILKGQTLGFKEDENRRLEELRRSVLKNEHADLIDMVTQDIDTSKKEYTLAVLNLGRYLVENRLLANEEMRLFEGHLKEILREKGKPTRSVFTYREFKKKQSIKTLQMITKAEKPKLRVSVLQKEIWMPELINCLVEIEILNNRKRYEKFALKHAKLLAVDYDSLRERYKDLHDQERAKMMEIDREKMKKFMDASGSHDLQTPSILLELINPENPVLSAEVLRYLNLLLRRDELILSNYRYKFTLPRTMKKKQIEDFSGVYKLTYISVAEAHKLFRAIEHNEFVQTQIYFKKMVVELEGLLKLAYTRLGRGDRMKKLQANLNMYASSKMKLTYSETRIPGQEDKAGYEEVFYFNVLNYYLANTLNYKYRKVIFVDLDLAGQLLKALIESYFYSENYGQELKIPKSALTFELDPELIKGSKFSKAYSETFIKVMLMLTYIFMLPTGYNNEFIEDNFATISELVKISMDKGSTMMKVMFINFLALLIRNNMRVLVKIDESITKSLMAALENSLKDDEHQVTVAILELLKTMVDFRGVNFIENSYFVCSEMLRVLNSRDSLLLKIVIKDLLKHVEGSESSKKTKVLEYGNFNWEQFKSSAQTQEEISTGMQATFKVSVINHTMVISEKVFELFRVLLSNDQEDIKESVRNTFALADLLKILGAAKDWWHLKKTLTQMIAALYIEDRISERNLDDLINGVEMTVYKDLQYFQAKIKKTQIANSAIFSSDLLTINQYQIEESVYKPFFGQIAYNKDESLKDYIVHGAYKLIETLGFTLRDSRFLVQKDLKIFEQLEDIFMEYNDEQGRDGDMPFLKKKFIPRRRTKDKMIFADEFYRKFRVKDNSDEALINKGQNLIDHSIYEMKLYWAKFQTKILYGLIDDYKKDVRNDFEKKGSGSEDLLQAKDELLPDDFLESINDEDYNEFIDSVLKELTVQKLKWGVFLGDLIALLKPRKMSYAQLRRLISILEKIIERSNDKQKTLDVLGKLGMFRAIVEKYIEHQHKGEVCLVLARFTILCTSLGLKLVQNFILEALYKDYSNSYAQAIKYNLKSNFTKFKQRELLRNGFAGKKILSKQFARDLDEPIEESSQSFITQLEMIRYFCEGHYLPMQNYLRYQSSDNKQKPNQVNMIQLNEYFMRKFTKIMTERNLEVGKKILEFFVEMLQGPCPGNQLEVTKFKVIETLEEMSTTLIYYFNNLEVKVKSGMINQMVLILLGVLESNEDKLIISKVTLNTNIDALWERLIQIDCLLNGTYSNYSNEVLEKLRKQQSLASKMKLTVTSENLKKSLRTLRPPKPKKGGYQAKWKKVKRKDLDAVYKNSRKDDEISTRKDVLEARGNIYTKDGSDYSYLTHEGINIAVLFKIFKSSGKQGDKIVESEYYKKLKEGLNRKVVPASRTFFFEKVLSIEIVNKENNLQRVYFPAPAITRFHSSYSKAQFEDRVDRRSANTKLTGMVENVPFTLYELRHFNKLSNMGISGNMSIVKTMKYLNFFLAFVINAIILVFGDIDDESKTRSAFRITSAGEMSWIEWVLFWMACALLFFYVLTLGVWFVLQYKVDKHGIKLSEEQRVREQIVGNEELDPVLLAQQEEEEETDARGGGIVEKKLDDKGVDDLDETLNDKTFNRRKEQREDNKMDKDKIEVIRANRVKSKVSWLRVSYRVLTETYLAMMLILIACNVLGLTYSKLFLSFLLIDIISLSQTLGTVIKAFTMKINALSITLCFGLIQLFVYSSITYFSFLRDSLTFIDDDNLEMCYNFIHCFVMTVNFGMRSGGGFGEALLYPGYNDDTRTYLVRTLFDLVFFVTIIIILLEIVFGLIVDSFGELREIKNTKSK